MLNSKYTLEFTSVQPQMISLNRESMLNSKYKLNPDDVVRKYRVFHLQQGVSLLYEADLYFYCLSVAEQWAIGLANKGNEMSEMCNILWEIKEKEAYEFGT